MQKSGEMTCEYENCGSCRVKEHDLYSLLSGDNLVNWEGHPLCAGCGEIGETITESQQIKENGIHDHCRPKQVARMVTRFGGIDGNHHKQWLIDQMLRVTLGNKEYQKWLEEMNSDTEYDPWDHGIAP